MASVFGLSSIATFVAPTECVGLVYVLMSYVFC